MTSNSSQVASSTDGDDPAKRYGTPNPLNKSNWTCNFCSKSTNGGAYRMKQHLVGDDNLTWSAVSKASGANDPIYSTRHASRVDKGKGVVASGSRRLLDEDEDEVGEEMEEDIGEDKDDEGDGDDALNDDDF
ncbi:uncharacterized protein LOC130996958 isoform X2 [Salvia miltiorrhiza]|uniref:uncharacterized protein LOC130996958 isoform X2 n=1 Tax=Salvia miltiorrhiza TaxID=226208 RepID=UPI0025AC5380|nr:uncharacterized protein LOC130996958 isoform X2 [Salvia miltiorrhiza]